MVARAKPKPDEAPGPQSWPADTPERVKIADLKPYPRNPRTHTPEQIDQIAASMREFKITTAILIDEDNMIIAGHGRVMAAAKLGLDEMPAVRLAGLTPAQKMALVIADNKIPANAGWDEDLLKLELGELRRLDFELNLTGFGEEQLVSYLAEPAQPTPPDGFQRFGEDIKTEHQCPKCNYRWSGGTGASPAQPK